jgi:hypothetical protein
MKRVRRSIVLFYEDRTIDRQYKMKSPRDLVKELGDAHEQTHFNR